MATDIDICNLALGRLGDEANVQSIRPADGSAQAAHCARFYPLARDTALAARPWTFATVRAPLALLTGDAYHSPWAYTYAQPNNCLRLQKVLEPDASDDVAVMGMKTGQPFKAEALANGTLVVFTNTPSAVAIYTVRVEDTSKYSLLFVDFLSMLLASYLAGPIIKGDAGRRAAQEWTQAAQGALALASTVDAAQQSGTDNARASWVAARG